MRIVCVDVDSLRADHTQPYGYGRQTTPHLDELARGRRLRPVLLLGLAVPAVANRPDEWTARHGAFVFLGNFRESIRASEETNDEDAWDVNRVALDWLRRHGRDENWFLHVNYWDPHTDYLISSEWVERAADSGPPPPWPDEAAVKEHADIYGPRTALDLHYAGAPRSSAVPSAMPDAVRSREDVTALMNGYDAAVMYWDEHLGALLKTLDELGIAGDTAVVVSADHGESLGENGSYAEHGLANEPTHRLPLVVSWPGITDAVPPTARRCDALLYNLDLGPTLCELLAELARQVVRRRGPRRRDRIEAVSRLRARRPHVPARRPHPRPPLHPHLPPRLLPRRLGSLFDGSADRHLTRNLVETELALVDELRARLVEWWTEYAGRPGAAPDPMQTTVHTGPAHYNDPVRYARHLRDTGRPHLAEDLEARLRGRRM